MKKQLLKIMSVILAVALTFDFATKSLISSGIEFDYSSETTDYYDEFGDDNVVEPEREILGELTELRTADTKRFLCSDGAVIVSQYDYPVHFLDSEGVWQDIDNSLESDTNSYSGYKIKNNEFSIKFADNSNSDKLFKFEKGKYKITWSLSGGDINDKNAIISTNSYLDDSHLSVQNISSSIKYTDIYDDIDLEYTIVGNEIKENIIVKDKLDSYSFSFEIKTNNLTLVLKDDGSIEAVNDDGEVVTAIPAPFMYDSKYEYSDNVSYTLTQKNKNKYVLTVTADESWINASERTFPVIIDPVLKTNTSSFTGSMVGDKSKTTNYNSMPVSFVGNHSGYGNSRAYFLIELPELSNGDVVVDAEVKLYQTTEAPTDCADAKMYVHKVTEAWSPSNITWNNKPDNEAVVADWAVLSADNTGSTVNLNITGMVREWYNGNTANNGFVIIGDEGSTSTSSVAFAKNITTSSSSMHPKLVLTYRNNVGLEDYWTYHTINSGNAGTAYVNDFSGNLVLVNSDISESGNRFPLNISHVYNGYFAGEQYAQYTADAAYLFSNMKFGNGWKLNLEQSIVVGFDSSSLFYYCDEDGTNHYMKVDPTDSSQYVDEDGLGLTMTVNSSDSDHQFILTDKNGNVKIFNNAGYLVSCNDANGNSLTITYSSNKITAVTDGAGRVTNLTYNSDGFLTRITDPAGKSITYTYLDGDLIKITYPDGTYASYSYNDDGTLETTTDSRDGYRITYTYNGNVFKRVASYCEHGNSSTEGQKVKIKYCLDDLCTTYQFSGPDGILASTTELPNSDDLLTTYVFDTYGRTVCAYTTDATGTKIYGADAQVFTTEKTSGKGNKITAASSSGFGGQNLLLNGQCESTDNWTYGYVGVNNTTANGATDSQNVYLGNGSLKVTATSALANSYSGYFQTVTLPAGAVTLSGYIKTSSLSGTGACFALVSSSNTILAEAPFVNGTTSTSVNSGWQRVDVTYTVPATNTYKVFEGIKNSSGTAYFDCIQLEASGEASNVNLLDDSSMESTDYWGTNISELTTTDGLSGNGITISGNPSAARYINQTVNINKPATETYILSGWAKADSVKISGSRAFRLRAVIYYSDGTYETVMAPFLSETSDWQFVSVPVVPKKTGETVASIKVCADYHYNCNTAVFDNISLIKEGTQSYAYDDDGNVISVADLAEQSTSLEYTDNNDLEKQTNPSGYTYNYTYDGKHNMLTAQSENGVKYTYTYDSYGNPLSLVTSNSGDTLKINSSTAYTSDGNYIASQSDARGYTTVYDINTLSGLLNSVTDPLSNRISYTYDSSDRIESVFADTDKDGVLDSGEIGVEYGYVKGLLSEITHNGFKYSFTYDDFGNIVSTKAGSNTLITHSYGTNNGNLLSSTYGNGATVSYTYDFLGRISEKKLNGVTAYTYGYDGDGNVTKITDVLKGTEYRFEYDTIGRLLRSYKVSGTTVDLSTQTVYDDLNRVSKQIYGFSGGTSKSYTYTYTKDNLVSNVALPTNAGIVYSYDGLNRLVSKVISGQYISGLTESYTYTTANSGTTTTNLVSKITYNDGSQLKYTYNKLNYIATIQDENSHVTTYEYDSIGQLTRENNYDAGKTYVYAYDNGGNITSVKEYAYTLSTTLGTATATHTYTYGNTSWKDLLTNYNGTTITYDEIGNPLTYRSGLVFSWENGRQLSKLIKNGAIYNYTYNPDGVRIGKSGAKNVTYEVAGTQILKETIGSTVIYYLYDEKGSPVGLTYNGTDYYYRKNLQGDIIEILDNSKTSVVQYTYNAWGEIISTTGTLKSTLGAANGLRYRGYYYDTESGLYYLNSRYYDPSTGRFVNADGYISTGQGLTGNNMFAYCGNNPINYYDPYGNRHVEHAGCGGGVAINPYGLANGVLDSAKSFASTVAPIAAAAGAVTGAAAVESLRQEMFLIKKYDNTDSKSQEKDITAEPPKNNQAYFPMDPNEFNPRGLDKKIYEGTDNGIIIKWFTPVTKKVIFEWDEDIKNSPHYHTMLVEWDGEHDGTHYKAGDKVPEPWNSMYF